MKKSILIVEDQPIIAEGLKSFLEECGYNILKLVSTGEKAVQSVKKNKPDLILMDAQLKGPMNGYKTIAEIRLNSDVPVIYSTGSAPDQIEEQAKGTQPYDYVIKPFDREALVNKIKKFTGGC